MSLDKYFKRYVWNEEKTPYLYSVESLTQRQADYEVYAYTTFVGVLFAAIAFGAVTGLLQPGKMMGVGLYAFSVVCGCVIFSFTKFYPAGLYVAAPPIAILLYFLFFGFNDKHNMATHAFVLVVIVGWACYSLRIASIAKAYPNMLERIEDH